MSTTPHAREEPTVARAAVRMGAVTAVSRGIGFVRVLVIAGVLGTTYLGNTFQASNTVSNVLFELVAAGALSAALVPGFVARLADGDALERTANALLGIAIVVLGAIAVVAMLNARAIATLLMSRAPSSAIGDQQVNLATFLLRWFLPQVVLYAVGAIAISVLHAKRQFVVGAVAPIASSMVLISTMVLFRVVAGSAPGLELSLLAKIILGIGGTLAVVAFVGVPLVAVWTSGTRLYPSLRWRGVGPQLRGSLWAVVLHAGLGALLAAALIGGNAVEGGVVAYQVAWTFFLAPYAILAQPIHTAILPELTLEAGSPDAFAASVRWSLAGMARLLIPVSVLLFAFARPIMDILAFGAASGGTTLLAAALRWLAVGLFPYGALLLATRAYFALGDTRTPAVLTLFGALIGACIMLLGTRLTHGVGVVVILGIGQTAGALAASIGLLAVLRSRIGWPVTPRILIPVGAICLPVGALLTWVAATNQFSGRVHNLIVYGALSIALVAAYGALLRWWRPLRLPERVAR
ncbi:MAG: murein biosynthesis integral membrane protein MurJ [Acidimicrobiia bacterium]